MSEDESAPLARTTAGVTDNSSNTNPKQQANDDLSHLTYVYLFNSVVIPQQNCIIGMTFFQVSFPLIKSTCIVFLPAQRSYLW